jgi:putative spermidine/putrescine transport system permease protein
VRLAGWTPRSADEPRNLWGWLVVPCQLWLLAVFLLPIVLLGRQSVYTHLGPGVVGEPVTTANHVRFLLDPFYLGILARTFLLGFAVVACCVIVAYPVSYFLARTRTAWRGLLIFLVVAPLLISVVIRNLGWMILLGREGFVNWLLVSVGVAREPLPLLHNFSGIVIGLTHALLPYMILMLTNVIRRIDYEYEEAAMNLGAGRWLMFRRVILPLSRPGLLAGSLLVFTLGISAFTSPAMLGGRKVLVMSTFIEQQVRSVLNYAFGATVSVILLMVTAGVTYVALARSGDRA